MSERLDYKNLSNEFYFQLEQLLMAIDDRYSSLNTSNPNRTQNADIERELGKLHYVYLLELRKIEGYDEQL